MKSYTYNSSRKHTWAQTYRRTHQVALQPLCRLHFALDLETALNQLIILVWKAGAHVRAVRKMDWS